MSKKTKERLYLLTEEDLNENLQYRKSEYNKLYNQINKDKIKQQAAERYKKNKEKRKEKVSLYGKEWYKTNAEEVKQKSNIRYKKYTEAYNILGELYKQKLLIASDDILNKIKKIYI